MILFVSIYTAKAQLAPYKNSTLPVQVRVNDPLGRMTLEEKFWQLFMVPGNLSIGKEKLKNGIMGFETSVERPAGQVAEQMLSYDSGNPVTSIDRVK